MMSHNQLAPTRTWSLWDGRRLTLIFTLLLLTACGPAAKTTSTPTIQITLLPIAADESRDALRVQLRNAEAAPITDATVTLEGNMNHAGMAPVITEPVTDDEDGTIDGIYRIPFHFSMLGDWIITVAVELADGSQTTKDIDVTVTDTDVQLQDEASGGMDQAGEQTAGPILVHNAMARAVPVAGGNGAIYFTLMNNRAEADRLVAVESDVAAATELHESITENDVIRMLPRPEGFAIPASGSVELAPGGKHVMLLNLEQPLNEGETIAITLRFELAEPISVTVPIMALGSTPASDHQHGD